MPGGRLSSRRPQTLSIPKENNMTKYIGKRLGQTLIIVLLVSFLTFLLVAVMPKDPVYILYGTDLTPEEYHT